MHPHLLPLVLSWCDIDTRLAVDKAFGAVQPRRRVQRPALRIGPCRIKTFLSPKGAAIRTEHEWGTERLRIKVVKDLSYPFDVSDVWVIRAWDVPASPEGTVNVKMITGPFRAQGLLLQRKADPACT